MGDKIKPIETQYKGYRFRSRLEARWAVFFDECGFKWEYEPEGFESDSSKYLPDFYLPDFDLYVEVKPNSPERISELNKACDIIKWGGDIKAVLVLSEIPYGNKEGLWHFPIIVHAFRMPVVFWWRFYDFEGTVRGEIVFDEYRYIGQMLYYNKDISAKNDMDLFRMNLKRIGGAVNDEKYDFQSFYASMRGQENPIVFNALGKARSARFEHGECG